MGISEDRWLSPEDLSAQLRIPQATVYQWKYRGVGPKAYRIGRHLRYRQSDVDAWIEQQADSPKPAD